MRAHGLTVHTAAAHRDYIATLSEDAAESLVLVARLQPTGDQLQTVNTQTCRAETRAECA
jgi:hypothetical protein